MKFYQTTNQEAKQDVEDLIEGNFDMSKLNKRIKTGEILLKERALYLLKSSGKMQSLRRSMEL